MEEEEEDWEERKKKNKQIYLAQSGGGIPGRDKGATPSVSNVESTSVVEQNAAKAMFQAHDFNLDLTLEHRPTVTSAWASHRNGSSSLETEGMTLQEYLGKHNM